MLSKTTEYALRAAVHLAEAGSGRFATAQAVAAATGVPEPYMAKVLHMLARAGIVRSQRGPTGGFGLASPADETTLLQIVRAVDPSSLNIERPESHEPRLRGIRRRIRQIVSMVEDALRETSVQDLLDADRAAQPPTPA